MKFQIFWAAAAAFALLTTGCKKDDSSTTSPGLTGLAMDSVIPYIGAGTTLTFKANTAGLTTSDSSTPGPIGIYWQLNSEARDTTTRDIKTGNPAHTITFTEIGSYTVHCYAYAEGYYNSSTSASVEVIDPETAVTGIPGTPDIVLNGNPYRSLQAGGLTWLGDNLYGTETGTVLLGCEVVAPLFGRYYTWEQARTACPEGWRLPTPEEFDSLGSAAGDLMVNAQFLEADLWSYRPEVSITNSLRFNALPAGYQDLTSESYADQGFGEYACWWTAAADEKQAEYRYLHLENPVVLKGKGSKTSLALSVRCVKEN